MDEVVPVIMHVGTKTEIKSTRSIVGSYKTTLRWAPRRKHERNQIRSFYWDVTVYLRQVKA